MDNDLTLGEYAIVITTQPERDTFEETQFDQAIRLRTEGGVAIPDTYIIAASRLRDKAKIIEAMEGDKNSRQKRKPKRARQQRAKEAEVATMEAEALSKNRRRPQSREGKKEAVLAEKEANTPPEDQRRKAKLAEVKLDYQVALQKLEAEYAFKARRDGRKFALEEEQHGKNRPSTVW